MKEMFINSSFNFISKHKDLDHLSEVKIKYGLEVLYHTFTKTFIITMLSIILDIFVESLLITLFYSLLRKFGHGIHFKKNITCWISSIIIYVLCGFTIKYSTFNGITYYSLYILYLLSFILWAPSDTKGRPLIHKEDRIRLKKMSLFVLLLMFMLSYYAPVIRSAITVSCAIQTFNINPFVYWIFKIPRNNYKSYSQ